MLTNLGGSDTDSRRESVISSSGSMYEIAKLERRPTIHNLSTQDIGSGENIPELPGLTKADVKTIFNLIEVIYIYSQQLVVIFR